MEDRSPYPKIPKLENALDYAEWKPIIKLYLHRGDQRLLLLQDSAEANKQAERADWYKLQVITKANSILHLGYQSFFEKEKNSTLISTLPESFFHTALVARFLDFFEKVEQAVRA